jgi:hypothetical protein
LYREEGPPLEHRLTQKAIVKMARLAGLEHVEVQKLVHMYLYRMAIERSGP